MMECGMLWLDPNIISDVARKIFLEARLQPTETFQESVLDLVKEIIPFDCGEWGTGIIHNDQPVVHAVHLHNLPGANIRHGLKFQQQDPMLARMILEPDRVTTYDRYEVTPREAFVQLPIYLEYCKNFGVEQLIKTMVQEPTSKLFSVISFARRDYESPFSHIEKKTKTIITPVLTEARRHNVYINMIKIGHNQSQLAAISDPQGVLHDVGPAFLELMRDEWPLWEGPLLKIVPEKLLNGRPSCRFTGKRIVIDISNMHNLVLLRARKRSSVDRLTPAESKVLRMLLQGFSDKQIARELAISPKTVGNHLQKIYKKTDIPNRSSLIAKFGRNSPGFGELN